ncbi:MAG: hypothetical protein JWN46_105 [Acidimicrobiales bacterium]|nr:hypothetical protein [Acidimicrobiales bacterium]
MAKGPEHPGQEATVLVSTTLLALACGWLLGRPAFVLFDRSSGLGGIETGWSSRGFQGAVYAGQGWVVMALLVPLVTFTLDDLRRVAQNRRLRWSPYRTVLASGVLGWLSVMGLTATGWADTSLALPAVASEVVVATVLVLVVAARRGPSVRRLVGWAVALIAGASALSAILALDDPTRTSQCAEVTIKGLSPTGCTAAVHRTLVHGVWADGLAWISAALLLVLAARRWVPAMRPGGRPPDLRAKRFALLSAGGLLAIAPVITVVSEVAVVRNWCTSAPVVRTFTRPPSCATTPGP